MDERIAWDMADDVHPLPDDEAVAGNLWTRRSALALTAGFFAVSVAPARAAYVQRPAPRASHIVVSKSNRVLALMQGEKTLKRYRIHLGFAPEGHKTRSGDGRTPEGRYVIDRRNARSDFHLSLGVSYPNALDVAAQSGTSVTRHLSAGWPSLTMRPPFKYPACRSSRR